MLLRLQLFSSELFFSEFEVTLPWGRPPLEPDSGSATAILGGGVSLLLILCVCVCVCVRAFRFLRWEFSRASPPSASHGRRKNQTNVCNNSNIYSFSSSTHHQLWHFHSTFGDDFCGLGGGGRIQVEPSGTFLMIQAKLRSVPQISNGTFSCNPFDHPPGATFGGKSPFLKWKFTFARSIFCICLTYF